MRYAGNLGRISDDENHLHDSDGVVSYRHSHRRGLEPHYHRPAAETAVFTSPRAEVYNGDVITASDLKVGDLVGLSTVVGVERGEETGMIIRFELPSGERYFRLWSKSQMVRIDRRGGS